MKELTAELISPDTPEEIVLQFLQQQFLHPAPGLNWYQLLCKTISAYSGLPSAALLKTVSPSPLVQHWHLPGELLTKSEILHNGTTESLLTLLRDKLHYPAVYLYRLDTRSEFMLLLLDPFQETTAPQLSERFLLELDRLCSLYESIHFKNQSDAALLIQQELVGINTSRDTALEPLMHRCLEAILRVPWFPDHSSAALFEFNGETSQMNLLTLTGERQGFADHCTYLEKGNCLCGISWEKGSPVFSESSSTLHRGTAGNRHKDLCFPLIQQSSVIGIVVFHLPQETFLSPTQFEITGFLTRTLALQLHHRQQHRTLVETARTLENRVAERTRHLEEEARNRRAAEKELLDINRNLDDRIRDRTVELVEAIKKMTLEADNRRQTEEALAHSERIYRTLVEASPNAIFLLDTTFHILKANSRAESLLHTAGQDQLKDVDFFSLIDNPEQLKQQLQHDLETGNILTAEKPILRFDGGQFSGEIGFAAQPDDSGHPFFVIAVMTDISERKLQEARNRELQKKLINFNRKLENKVRERTAELRDAMDKANLAVRTRNAFLASMSHELRTPLNSIIGFSEVLLEETEGPLNATQKSDLHEILESGHHLLKLLNQILEMSRFEGEKHGNEIEPCDIQDVIDTAAAMIRGQAFKKGINLEWEKNIPPGLPPVETDANKLRHILFQLLSNAIKFTPSGGQVDLNVEIERPTGRLIFIITDNGIGIDPAEQQHIFEKFYQIHTGHTDKPEGTGLGLSFAMKLTQQLLGTLTVSSAGHGRGSAFTLIIPIKTIEQE